MNYLKLNIGGKERGAKLGLFFLQNLQKSENKNMQEIALDFSDQNNLVFILPRYIYQSLLTNCQLNGETPDFNMADVYDWIEEDGFTREDSALILFLKAFTESITKLIPEDKRDEFLGKKKLPKKALTPTSGSKK